ncbi:MAG: FkbM family methyltransferase [Burkholderiales bacterium]
MQFICVEPDDEFFALLESNSRRIRALDETASIELIKALVGASKGTVLLQGAGGTKSAICSAGNSAGMTRRALDDLTRPSRGKEVHLIKSDVDGYDYDVIESGLDLIESKRPILFFECQFDHEFQKHSYERLIKKLFSMGYGSFAVFDNFGEVMIQTENIGDVSQLFDYLWRQNSKRTSRTLYYYDILVSEPKHSELVTTCLTDYLELYMPAQNKAKL